MSIEISYRSFPPKIVHGVAVTPHIQMVQVELKAHRGRCPAINLLTNNRELLANFRRSGFYKLPEAIDYPGDAFVNKGVNPNYWFKGENTNEIFKREVARNVDAAMIVASNAGNAPTFAWEVNYDESQGEHALAAKDHETTEKPLPGRNYYCLLGNDDGYIDLGYVRFTSRGEVTSHYVQKAIGGRPLVHCSRPVHLAEILQKSITDPRHVLLLPEVPVGETYLPLGLRTIQSAIRQSQAASLTALILNDQPLQIDLDLEQKCCGELTPGKITEALLAYGYRSDEYKIFFSQEHGNFLRLKARLNAYRHTFWARRGQEMFIGIIGNKLPPHPDAAHQDIYSRVLKPVGLTIPELQSFLVDELGVEEAILMGNGKDPRIYISEYPHDPGQVIRLADDDARDSISAGLVSLVV